MAVEGEVVKRKLEDLRVIDLRAELEKRGCDKAGVKAVLLERLQQALKDAGADPENFYFEVTEPSPVKKTKRTNKKLSRDDESETHSNVDESQNDIDDEKMDSDDERNDKALEAADVVEDAINLSIEEEEKLLTEEDDGIAEKEEKATEGKDQKSESSGHTSAPSSSKSDCGHPEKSPVVVPLSSHDAIEISTSDCTTIEECESGTPSGDSSSNIDQESADNLKPSDEERAGRDAIKIDGKAEGDSKMDVKESSSTGGAVSSEVSRPGNSSNDDGGSAVAVASGSSNDNSEKPSKDVAVKVEKKDEEKGSTPSVSSASSASAKAKSVAGVGKDSKVQDHLHMKKASISSRNLWVSGLSHTTRATDLKNLFSKYGKVIGAKIVTNAHSPIARYYGFVTMNTSEEATKCIQHLHRIELHGRMISVEKARNEPVGHTKKVGIVTKKPVERKDVKPAVVKPNSEKDSKVEKSESESDVKSVAKEEVVEKKEENSKKEEVVEKDLKREEDPKEVKGSSKGSLDSKSRSRSRDRHARYSRSSSSRTYTHIRRHPMYRGGFRMMRRPMLLKRRPFIIRPRNLLTFKKITAERIRQREREEERELREVERRRHQEFIRQRDIERKQREESIRLERERERLRVEREKLEREKAEVFRLEREKQRLERERIEREREDLRRREFSGGSSSARFEENRRPFKRPFDIRSSRDDHYWDRNKRPNLGPSSSSTRFGGPPGSYHGSERGRGGDYDRKVERPDRRDSRPADDIRYESAVRRSGDISRRDPPVHDHDDRRVADRNFREVDRYDRSIPQSSSVPHHSSRDSDMRGSRDRDGPRGDRIGPSRDVPHIRRPSPRQDWKPVSQDRGRGHGPSHDSHERFGDSGKGLSSSDFGNPSRSIGESRYSGDRSGDSWHGGPSSSSDHRGGSKPYASSAGSGGILGSGPSRDSWGDGERKLDGAHSSQSWGRTDGPQGDRWGGSSGSNIGGGLEPRGIRSQQGMSMSQSVLSQTGSSMYVAPSGVNPGGMVMGLGSGGSYSGDRYDAYKSVSSMRRY